VRNQNPNMQIIVHPECRHEVVQLADKSGSTNFIIEAIEASPTGSAWAVGTEMNLVNRLISQHPDKEIVSLNPHMCPCLTMNRIDLQHLAWCLDSIVQGEERNVIRVESDVAEHAKLALERMLEHT
jgi:quinolinate synthase